MRDRQRRPQRDRPPEGRLGLGQLARHRQRRTEGRPGVGVVRLLGDGPPEQGHRLLRLPGRVQEQAVPVQGPGLIGVGGQHLPVDRLGLARPPGLGQGGRRVERLLDRRPGHALPSSAGRIHRPMTVDQLVQRHPILYHMADARNLPAVRAAGLLSTSALPTALD